MCSYSSVLGLTCLVRPGLYSRNINIEAWNALLIELREQATEQVVKAIFQPDWVRTDIQIFVRQLAACHLTDWCVQHDEIVMNALNVG